MYIKLRAKFKRSNFLISNFQEIQFSKDLIFKRYNFKNLISKKSISKKLPFLNLKVKFLEDSILKSLIFIYVIFYLGSHVANKLSDLLDRLDIFIMEIEELFVPAVNIFLINYNLSPSN